MFEQFSEFLDALTDRTHAAYQAAWREFERRYAAFLLGKIHIMVRNQPQALECFSRVLERLVDRDFKAIRDFRERDSESAFRVYLRMIVRSIVFSSKSERATSLDEVDLPAPAPTNEHLNRDAHARLAHSFRSLLLAPDSRKELHMVERDIFVFALRTVAGFESRPVSEIPVLGLSPHGVDIVVSRMRSKLKDH